MKTIRYLFFSIILIASVSLLSCSKKTTDDPNQLLITRMKAVTDSIVENTMVPGIVALVVDKKHKIDWLNTSGVSDIPAQLPMNAEYTFRIGSNTKTLTGTVLLQLVDEGKLNLDDKLSRFFPEFPKSDSVTIAMLCNMTSGIFNFTDDETWQETLISNPGKTWLPSELISVGFDHDFYFQPGTGWMYSNTNTIILGLIIEQLTGNSLETEINNRILQPLQMSHSGFLTSGTVLPGIHGHGYYMGEYVENEDLTEVYDLSYVWAAGSAYSTPRELQKFVETLVAGGFLSDSLQQKRLEEIYPIMPGLGYGLCLFKRGSFYGHNGAVMGFTSSMYHSIEKDCTVIIYFNCLLETQPDYLFNRFMDILYGGNS